LFRHSDPIVAVSKSSGTANSPAVKSNRFAARGASIGNFPHRLAGLGDDERLPIIHSPMAHFLAMGDTPGAARAIINSAVGRNCHDHFRSNSDHCAG
jgi:hypothetical protein